VRPKASIFWSWADEPRIEEAAEEVRRFAGIVNSVEADLSTKEGVDKLCDAIQAREKPVYALLANAGRGLGKAFLDRDFEEERRVIDTNITGTLYLIHKIGASMRGQREGRILITGSIAGFIPGSYQAVYNGTKAFLDSFSYALRDEMKDSGVTVTCLMPGATETKFFERAGMMDTEMGRAKKDDAAQVARLGFDAMMKGEGGVITGWQNKFRTAMAKIMPAGFMAERYRKAAEPKSNKV
jgi:uncharacterized protein